MTSQGEKRIQLQKREALCKAYRGPRSQMAQSLRPFMGWVLRHFRWRLPEVTVCYADRATTEMVSAADLPIEAEFRLDLDRHLPYELERPEGSEVRVLPAETILAKSYRGDLEAVVSDMVLWLGEMERNHKLARGYRQRYVKIGNPESPEWEIEAQVVLAGG